jgi:hypothetical protein
MIRDLAKMAPKSKATSVSVPKFDSDQKIVHIYMYIYPVRNGHTFSAFIQAMSICSHRQKMIRHLLD